MFITKLYHMYHEGRAGPLGIEPRSSVLETDVLPLNYGPILRRQSRRLEYILPHGSVRLFLGFLVLRVSFAPFAVLFELNFARDKLTVLARPVVDAVALRTRESEKLIL